MTRSQILAILAAAAATIIALMSAGCLEPYAVTRATASDTPETLAVKAENAKLIADIERIKAESAAAQRRMADAVAEQQQRARQEIADAQKTAEMEREAARREREIAAAAKEQDTYSFNKWLGLVIAASIACVGYCFKRLSFTGAFLGLLGFGGIFCAIFAGKYYPRYLPFAPLVICPALLYAAHRAGILRSALVAACRGVEIADDDNVKRAIRAQDGAEKIEEVRDEIDAAQVQLARARKHMSRASSPADIVTADGRDEIEKAINA